MNTRIVFASTIAPPAAIGASALVVSLMYSPSRGESWFQVMIGNLWLMLGIGVPLAYYAELIVGVPAYRWLIRRNRLRFAWLATAAAVSGILAFGFPCTLLLGFGRLRDVALAVFIGAFGGVVGGVVFWRTAFGAVGASRSE